VAMAMIMIVVMMVVMMLVMIVVVAAGHLRIRDPVVTLGSSLRLPRE
jgi:hypothetical protein